MRFITEFNIEGKKWQGVLSAKKTTCKWDLASLIEEKIGWENPVYGNKGHYKLEIEAFPMDKWIEFKKRFFDALPDYDACSRVKLEDALSDLEDYHLYQQLNRQKEG